MQQDLSANATLPRVKHYGSSMDQYLAKTPWVEGGRNRALSYAGAKVNELQQAGSSGTLPPWVDPARQ